MDTDRLLDFAAQAGVALLGSGAETSRVEDTLKRMINSFYSGSSEVMVVLTGFFINIGSSSRTVRVRERTINLDKVAKINTLSRNIVDSGMSLDRAEKRLRAIIRLNPYPMWMRTAAVASSSGFFTLLHGGGWLDGLNSFTVGAAVYLLLRVMRRVRTAGFIITLTGGSAIALLASALHRVGLGTDMNAMITGAIMPLVPGLAITNALRDIIAGDYLSGGARLFDALVTASALASGAGAVMYILGHMTEGFII